MSVKPEAVTLQPAWRLSSLPVAGLLQAWLILNSNMPIAVSVCVADYSAIRGSRANPSSVLE